MSSVGWFGSAGGWLLYGTAVLVALVLGDGSAVSAQQAPWIFGPGTPIAPQMELTSLPNSGPSIALLSQTQGQTATAMMAYYNGDNGPLLYAAFQKGTNGNDSAWLGSPQPIPLQGVQANPLTPISGASVCQTTTGALAAWSTSANGRSDYIAYVPFVGVSFTSPTVGCLDTSPDTSVQPAAAWNTDNGGADYVNIYSRNDAGQVFSADQIDYKDMQCQASELLGGAPVPSTAVGAAFDPRENNQAGQFFVFTCSSGKVWWTADGGETKSTDLLCTDDTTIAAVFVSVIPLSNQQSGIVFFYKYLGAVYYGYRVTQTGQVQPAGTTVGYSTGLMMGEGTNWAGGPGAVWYSAGSNMLVVYQGEAAGTIYQGWGVKAGQ